MKFAFCLYHYFPYGGLQRDCLRIANTCKARGHDVHIYTMAWDGEKDPGLMVHELKSSGMQNHTRCLSFVKQLESEMAKETFDAVVGFNKLPNLDVYYAADGCYEARVQEERSWLYRWLPRYRQYAALEKAVFARGGKTEILVISPPQVKEYKKTYQTESERLHALPPGIDKNRRAPDHADMIRNTWRTRYQFQTSTLCLLMVGSGFKTKGVDRSLRAIAALPSALRARCELLVIGKDDPDPFIKLAKKLQIENQVRFLGGRDDVTAHLLAADVLLHPSYHENTGTAILEAMIAGLPVLTVSACGYATYVTKANAGEVVQGPFSQPAFNQALLGMLTSDKREEWGENGRSFGERADLYSMPQKAADIIEIIGRRRHVS